MRREKIGTMDFTEASTLQTRVITGMCGVA